MTDAAESGGAAALKSVPLPDGSLSFDRLAALAARALGGAVGIVCLAEDDLAAAAPGGAPACAVGIHAEGGVPPTGGLDDPRLLTRPEIAARYFAFHAREPLRAADGRVLGTLHVLDPAPRTLDARAQATLRDLAGVIADLVDFRRGAARAWHSGTRLREVSQGLVAATGDDFFRSLVRQLTQVLGVAYAFVAERASPDTARVIAMSADGTVMEGITYPLAGSPCLDLLEERACTIPTGLRAAYPDDRMLAELGVESYVGSLLRGADGDVFGWLAIMDRNAVADLPFAEAVVRLFALRVAAELERRRVETSLRDAHDALQRSVTERTRALALSEEKFAKAFRASPNAVTISRAAGGELLEVNDTFLRWHGLRREDAIGRTSLELDLWVDPDDRERMLGRLAAEGAVRQFEFWFRRRSGERRLGQLSAERLDIAGELCLLIEVSDITEHRLAEEALRESEARHQSILDNATNVVWVKDAAGRHLLVNRQFERLFNLPRETASGRRDEELFAPELAVAYRVTDEQVLRTGQRVEFESTSVHDDGVHAYIVQKFPLRDATGRPYAVCGIATDITERKRAEERLLHDAFHDSLTALPNRALFMDRLGRAVERARRHPIHLFAVLFLDLDRFKLVNDGLGHAAGDELLVEVGRTLVACLRPEDSVARLGGDEFALLLDGLDDPHDATRVAERIQQALAQPVRLSHQEVFPTASIGIALSTTGYARAADVMRDADTAMYRAKAAGRARAEVFDAAMHAHAVALLRLETDLRQAVERREFELHYQPILGTVDGRLLGYEALLRWRHPTRGLLYPAEFLEAAEDTGLIVPIGYWVLEQACRQLRQWQDGRPDGRPLVISVNLCGRQFLEPDLVDRVAAVLAATGVDPRALMLEITESVLMDRTGMVATTLQRLRDLQVRMSIDDFGTGYSSLSYLHRFPIDVLKIDRSFVNTVDCGDDEREIVRAIVTLAHTLSMDVIAEGVETADQLACLRALGCNYVQGFLFARPRAAGALRRPLAPPTA